MGILRSTTLALAAAASLVSLASAQTYTKCNPLSQTCPPDPALGGAVVADFSAGASNQFDAVGNSFSYNGGEAQLIVAGSGDNPTFISKWYIMFGKVDVVMKTAPGVGMVSSFILQSDDLDEIDWEILGADPTGAQTNYFGKGVTGTYNREITVAAPTSQTAFNTYSIEYTPQAITWSINGGIVRTLTPSQAAAAGNPFPQTPMQVRVGAWAGGDPSNNAGTIQWAGGAINYADGPFVMSVKSISVTDYSTGSEYKYTDNSGSWQSIQAVGGSVDVGAGGVKVVQPASSAAPSSAPAPQTTPAGSQHTGYPWVPTKTRAAGHKPAGAGAAATTSTPPWASMFPSSSPASQSPATSSPASSSHYPSSSGAPASSAPSGFTSVGTVTPIHTVKPTSTPTPPPIPNAAGRITGPAMAMLVCGLSLLALA